MKYASLTAKSLRSIGGMSEVGGISEEILEKLAQDATYRIRMLLQVFFVPTAMCNVLIVM